LLLGVVHVLNKSPPKKYTYIAVWERELALDIKVFTVVSSAVLPSWNLYQGVIITCRARVC